MHASTCDRVVPPREAGSRRRDFVRSLALAWLSMPVCCIATQSPSLQPGSAELRRARRSFDDLAHEASLLDLDARPGFINVAVNQRIVYACDPASAPGGDEWSTPYETLARGCGDCEDFAITKYFLLIASGAPQHGVRLLYARCRGPDLTAPPMPHMVTIARWPLGDPWVLDNINPLVVALTWRDDLEPVFSFNASGVWPGAGIEPLPPKRGSIQRWRATQARTHSQSHDTSFAVSSNVRSAGRR